MEWSNTTLLENIITPDLNTVYDNINKNLNLIKKWLNVQPQHDKHAIIVSGGPDTNYSKIKYLINNKKDITIYTVKHGIKGLIKNNIIPDYCVIGDTLTINDFSTWKKKRIDLISEIPKQTKIILLSRANPEYTNFFLENGLTVIGIHKDLNEVFKIFVEKRNLQCEDYHDLINKINKSALRFQVSCSALLSLSIGIHTGYRNFSLFGFNGSLNQTEVNLFNGENTKEIIFNNVTYISTPELLYMVREIEHLANVDRHIYNLNIEIDANNTLISKVWEKNILKPEEMYIRLDDDNEIRDIYNLPFNHNNKIILLGIESINEYKLNQSNNLTEIERNAIFSNYECLKNIANYLKRNLIKKSTDKSLKVICHGCSFGYEIKYLSELLNTNDIIGTDIRKINNILNLEIEEHDFHYIKNEWVNEFDIIYSNSLDHSYDPKKCILNWLKCLNKNGVLIIEWSDFHNTDFLNQNAPFKSDPIILQNYLSSFTNVINFFESDDSIPIIHRKTSKKIAECVRYFYICKSKLI